MQPEETPELTLVCAWCSRVLVQGRGEKISHGICEDCLPGVVKEILERIEAGKDNEEEP